MNFNLLLKIVCWFLISGFLLSTIGCVKVIELPLPNYVPQPVLSGILSPDSIIQVRLTQSGPVNDPTAQMALTNAVVYCYEDDLILGRLEMSVPGIYRLAAKPQPGHRYRISARLSSGQELWAEDEVPILPAIEARLTEPKPQNINQNPDVFLKVEPVDTTRVRLWLSAYLRVSSGNQSELKTEVQVIQSNSLLLDFFNSERSEDATKRNWIFYARLRPEYQTKSATIIFNTFNRISEVNMPDEQYILQVFAGGKSFDRYLKTYITAYANRLTNDDGTVNNPFAEQIPVYSNVSGGLGILIGVNIKTIVLLKGLK